MATTTTSNKVILAGPKDWRPWIEVIKTACLEHDIWEYINPETEKEKLPVLSPPIEPENPLATTQGNAPRAPTTEETQLFLALWRSFEYKRKQFDQKHAAIQNLRKMILESLHTDNHVYTWEYTTTADVVRALHKVFCPTDLARESELVNRIEQLKRTPMDITPKGVEKWLREWEIAYTEATQLSLPEVSKDRAVQKLVHAIHPMDPAFADKWQIKISEKETIQFTDLVKQYRNYRRDISTRPTKLGRGNMGAFSASTTGTTGTTPSLQGRDQEWTKLCVCGEKHRFSECLYLVETRRPIGWKADLGVQQKIDKKLANNSRLKSIIDRVMTKGKATDNSTPKSMENQVPVGMVASIIHGPSPIPQIDTAFSTNLEYRLKNSFILDSGATIHICNNIQRFVNFDPQTKDILLAGTQSIPVQGYGSVQITTKCPGQPNGERKIWLYKVAYIPGFHTNVVSNKTIKQKGFKWDDDTCLVTYNGQVVFQTPVIEDQWVVEYNPLEIEDSEDSLEKRGGEISQSAMAIQRKKYPRHPNSTTLPHPPSKATMAQWHDRFGHLNVEALGHLPKAVQGVEIISKELDVERCEPCALSTSQKIVSRVPRALETTPFRRVHFDLIDENEGMESGKWIIHFLEETFGLHFVVVLPNKKQESVLTAIQDFVQFVKKQWKLEVAILHLDGEKALGGKWLAWVKIEGILVETSPPSTAEQNGKIEASGKTIIRRAGAMRIRASLPLFLWPDLSCTQYS